MADILTRQQRSALMSKIRAKDTKPEMIVRRLAHSLGYRFRLHRRDLPGSPDLIFPSRKKAIFVHGCFWHRHCCGRAYAPKTRAGFWKRKFLANVARDRWAKRALRRAGWKVLVIWECQTLSGESLLRRLARFLDSPASDHISRAPAASSRRQNPTDGRTVPGQETSRPGIFRRAAARRKAA